MTTKSKVFGKVLKGIKNGPKLLTLNCNFTDRISLSLRQERSGSALKTSVNPVRWHKGRLIKITLKWPTMRRVSLSSAEWWKTPKKADFPELSFALLEEIVF